MCIINVCFLDKFPVSQKIISENSRFWDSERTKWCVIASIYDTDLLQQHHLLGPNEIACLETVEVDARCLV